MFKVTTKNHSLPIERDTCDLKRQIRNQELGSITSPVWVGASGVNNLFIFRKSLSGLLYGPSRAIEAFF